MAPVGRSNSRNGKDSSCKTNVAGKGTNVNAAKRTVSRVDGGKPKAHSNRSVSEQGSKLAGAIVQENGDTVLENNNRLESEMDVDRLNKSGSTEPSMQTLIIERCVGSAVVGSDASKSESAGKKVNHPYSVKEYELMKVHVTVLKNRLKKDIFSRVKFANDLDLHSIADEIAEHDLKIKQTKLASFRKSITRHIKIQTSHVRCAVTRSFKKNLLSKYYDFVLSVSIYL